MIGKKDVTFLVRYLSKRYRFHAKQRILKHGAQKVYFKGNALRGFCARIKYIKNQKTTYNNNGFYIEIYIFGYFLLINIFYNAAICGSNRRTNAYRKRIHSKKKKNKNVRRPGLGPF